jgi:SET domain-containing protein
MMESPEGVTVHATYPVEVVNTTSGIGLFATDNLGAETVIGTLEGPIMHYDDVPAGEVQRVIFVDDHDNCLVPRNELRLVRHSCEPNCRINDKYEIETIREVKRGEELTVIYRAMTMNEFLDPDREEFFWDPRWTFECHCGSKRCVGVVDRHLVEPIDDPNDVKTFVYASPGRGRGVFAKRRIRKGETIERAPVIVFTPEEAAHIEHTVLFNYVHEWGENDEGIALALGNVSVYNHSYTPNAMYQMCFEDRVMEVVALQDIRAGSEIFCNYNGDPKDQELVWFDDPEQE